MRESWSWKRFGHLLAFDMRRDAFKVLVRAGVVFILSLLAYIFVSPDEALSVGETIFDNGKFCFVGFMGLFMVYIMGLVNSVKTFSAYNRRESGWLEILLPASRLEKYFSAYVWSAILVPLVFILLNIAAFIMVVTFNPNLGMSALTGTMGHDMGAIISFLSMNMGKVMLVLGTVCAFWVMCQSIMFAGGAVFRKHPMILTIASIILISVIVNAIVRKVLSEAMNIVGVDAPDMIMESMSTMLWGLIIGFGVVSVCSLAIGWVSFYRKSVV